MTNVAMWALIVGFFSPLVLAVIQQPGWSNPVRSVVAFLYSAVAAAGTIFFTNGNSFTGTDNKDWVSTFLFVFVSTIAFYRGFWKTTNVAPKLEAATSPK